VRKEGDFKDEKRDGGGGDQRKVAGPLKGATRQPSGGAFQGASALVAAS